MSDSDTTSQKSTSSVLKKEKFSQCLERLSNEYLAEISSLGMTHRLPMLKTLVQSPTGVDLDILLSKESSSYVLNCGGTNWQCVSVSMDSNGVTVDSKIVARSFDDVSSRNYSSLRDFVSTIADLLYDNIGERKTVINSVALVLGFPQEVFRVEYGIDAKLTKNGLTKDWYIGGKVNNRMIGELLMDIMDEKYNVKIKRFVCGNDAALMMWDLSVKLSSDELIAPIGGVWGTGTNIGVVDPKVNEIVNTEMGSAIALLTEDDINTYKKMKELRLHVPDQIYTELFVGGDYLLYGFVAKLYSGYWEKLSDKTKKYLTNKCKCRGNSDIISKIACSESSEECEQLLKLGFNLGSDFLTLYRIAMELLDELAYRIALMIISAVKYSRISNDKKWVISVEGGVITNAYGVHQKVTMILKENLPDYSLRLATDGSSKKALAIFAQSLSI